MDQFNLEDFNSYFERQKKLFEPTLKQIRQFEKMTAPQAKIIKAASRNAFLATESYNQIRLLIPDLKKFYMTNFSSNLSTKEDSIETKLSSLETTLEEFTTKQDFSSEEKDNLLLASKFIADQNIQESNEIRDYLESITDSLIEDSHEVSSENDLVSDKAYDSKQKEKPINQSSEPSFSDVFFNEQTFYQELSSFIYQALFAVVSSVISGSISPMTLLIIVSVLSRMLNPPKK